MKVHHRDGCALSPDSAANGTAPPFAPTAPPRTTTPQPDQTDLEATAVEMTDPPHRPAATGRPACAETAPVRTTGHRSATAAHRAVSSGDGAASTAAGPSGGVAARSGRRDPAALVEGLDTLVADARDGQAAAMTELVKRFTPLVRAVVRRAGVYGAEAEDVEQETWLRLAVNIHRVREPTALPRWLSVTAGRLCSGLFDKRRRVMPAGDFSDDTWLSSERWSDPADFVCLQDEVGRLYGAIDTLGSRDRQLVGMLMDAVPYREISARIAMPVGSIGPTRERVLRKLAVNPGLRPSGAVERPAATSDLRTVAPERLAAAGERRPGDGPALVPAA